MMIKNVLVTGANVGLGKECARQLSLLDGVEKVYLGCRRDAMLMEPTAEEAKAELEEATGGGGALFDILPIDVSNTESVRKAVQNIKEPLEGLVLNAGGKGGPNHADLTDDGVSTICAANVLGHALLVDLLLEKDKLISGSTVVLSGSESARGVPELGLPKPTLADGSVEEFISVCDGSSCFQEGDKSSPSFNKMYGPVKLLGALWMSSMARKHPEMRFVTMSPGATSGTMAARDLSRLERLGAKIVIPIFKLLGRAHNLETGAKRYVDALTDDQTYKSGIFYASKNGTGGPVVDQSERMDELRNEQYQDNTHEAIHTFLS